MDWRDHDGIRWLEAELPGARAAFSTRLGGASAGAFESLNLGLYTDDGPDAVRANRLRLAAALGRDPEAVLFGFQVHGAEVARREEAPRPNPFTADARPAEGDGQVTSNPTLTPLVQVADCLPIALAGERGVAMVHGGWRGLAAGIVERGVSEVGARAAAIGPGIGPCCYEVGDEVLGEFAALGDGVADGRMLDLPEVARRLLAKAGVEAVESSGLCTSCEAELFFSHRRDGGRTGRQAGLSWVTDG
ncbi:MAG: purine-nucleoside/S-methyl-5-thioadenosine phosphorylase / adenosine deaminase [Solirubrobacterales bacterium]|jgi:YfiH family protein|nr:purine-nucleoside/S-methyl-5-thioadenosine phosphorylase / adenosine deaminase [Solirubrobacterales bacterium]